MTKVELYLYDMQEMVWYAKLFELIHERRAKLQADAGGNAKPGAAVPNHMQEAAEQPAPEGPASDVATRQPVIATITPEGVTRAEPIIAVAAIDPGPPTPSPLSIAAGIHPEPVDIYKAVAEQAAASVAPKEDARAVLQRFVQAKGIPAASVILGKYSGAKRLGEVPADKVDAFAAELLAGLNMSDAEFNSYIAGLKA